MTLANHPRRESVISVTESPPRGMYLAVDVSFNGLFTSMSVSLLQQCRIKSPMFEISSRAALKYPFTPRCHGPSRDSQAHTELYVHGAPRITTAIASELSHENWQTGFPVR